MFSPGEIKVVADMTGGVLLIQARGFLGEEKLAAAAERIQHHDRMIRARHGRVRVKLLTLGGIVQSLQLIQRAQAFVGDISHPDDRVAIVVGSSLLRMQLTRIFKGVGMKAFGDEDEADRWLCAA